MSETTALPDTPTIAPAEMHKVDIPALPEAPVLHPAGPSTSPPLEVQPAQAQEQEQESTSAEAGPSEPRTFTDMPPAPSEVKPGTILVSEDHKFTVTDVKDGKVYVNFTGRDGKISEVAWSTEDYRKYREEGRIRMSESAPSRDDNESAEEADPLEESKPDSGDYAEAGSMLNPNLAGEALLLIRDGGKHVFEPISAEDIEAVNSGTVAPGALADLMDLQIGALRYQALQLEKKHKTPQALELTQRANKLQQQRNTGKIEVVNAGGTYSVVSVQGGLPTENRVASTASLLARHLGNDKIAEDIDQNPALAFSVLGEVFNQAVQDPYLRENLVGALRAIGVDDTKAGIVGAATERVHKEDVKRGRRKTLLISGGALVALLAMMLKRAAKEGSNSGKGG